MKALLLLLVLAALAGTTSAHPTYRLTMLKPLDGYDSCDVTGINDAGLIVGNSFNMDDDPQRPMATYWLNGQPFSMGTLGGDWSIAMAVNQDGQIVGYADVGQNGGTHAFSYRVGKGHLHDLTPYPPYQGTSAHAINDKGIIIGSMPDADGLNNDVLVIYHGVVTSFESGDGAAAIGNDGTLVMQASSDGSYVYTRKNGRYQYIFGGYGYGINSSGSIVGYGMFNGYWHAKLYTAGTVRILEVPAGQSYCVAYAVNEEDEVVGRCNARATLWRDDKSFDLLDMVVDGVTTGWGGMTALGVNGKGQIVGTGQRDDGYADFLLTPIRAEMASGP